MEDNISSPLATCPTKNRSITRDIWQDANDPELRVQGRISQSEMLEVRVNDLIRMRGHMIYV